MTEPRPNSEQPEPPEELDDGKAVAETEGAEPEATQPADEADGGGTETASPVAARAPGGPGAKAVPPERPGKPAAPALRRGRDTRGGAGAQAPAAAPGGTAGAAAAGEPLTYVDDPVSRIWVGIVVGAFTVVFLYAALLGHSGILSPKATPAPLHTVSPSVTVSAAPAASSGAATSPATSPAASLGAAASPAASPATPTPTPS